MSSLIDSGALRSALLAALFAALVGCSSSKKTAIYDHENFDESGTFSRTYPVTDIASCEAARRALLSQGYIITSSDPKLVSGHKSFQQTGETHMEISFNVVCAPDAGHGATMFANALQDRYALKKTNNSASLGVGVLGSVSMPIGSTDDSMVKVASETVTSDQFYDRYFALVEVFLPKGVKPKAPAADQPKGDLGVPEPAQPAANGQLPSSAPVPTAAPAASATVPAAEANVAPVPAASMAPTPTEPTPTATESLPTSVPTAPATPAQRVPLDPTVESQPVAPPAAEQAPIVVDPAAAP
jgi:hypothetical protein